MILSGFYRTCRKLADLLGKLAKLSAIFKENMGIYALLIGTLIGRQTQIN
jgi:hypothetical protein